MYQLKGTGREKNIHLHSVSQSSWRWLGVCNPPSVGGDAEESVLGKARIPLRIGLGLFQAHFFVCVCTMLGVGVFAGEVRMCGVERHICGVPAEGAQVTDPPPPRGACVDNYPTPRFGA